MKKRKTAANLVFAVLLIFASSAPAALVITTANQTGTVPFTPTWMPAADSLIAGLAPQHGGGKFQRGNYRPKRQLPDGR